MIEIKVVTNTISKVELQEMAEQQFGDMLKIVVDVDKQILAVGGDLHADEEAVLLEAGSEQSNLWGINYFFDVSEDETVEFDSMINIRPSQNNRSRGVENPEIQKLILEAVNKLVI